MSANRSQPYRFGWVMAVVGLEGAYPNIQDFGLGVGLLVAVWSLLMGLAAAFVQPWGWYVLMGSYPLQLVFAPLSFVFIVTPSPLVLKVIFLALAPALATVAAVYFYRRRATFGATWRWRTGERWWPRLAGPDVSAGGATRGFLGLSWRRRLVLVVVVGLLLLMRATL